MSKKREPPKIWEVTTSPPQDVDCSFCGEKASNTIAAVLSMQSASVICANCVISFSAHIEMVYDAVIEGSLGDTVH